MTESAKQRAEVRRKKEWKQLRIDKSKEQEGLDFLTQKKLSKKANCHHLDQRKDIEYYGNLSPDRFIMLNSKSHDCVHFLFTYWLNDPEIIERLVNILELMKTYSED